MKAAILEKINEPLVIGDVELTPLKVGQVLIKILVSGLCGSQLLEIKGYKNNAKFVPHLLGHEGCGIVEDTGDGVTKVKKGDKVVMHWMKGDGIESDFPNYVYKGNIISSGKITTLSEYSIVSENRLTVVPKDSDPEICALFGCSVTTALGTINNDAQVKFGENIMIIGCGGVGLNLVQGAKLAGACYIFGVDVEDEKEVFFKKLGGDFYINSKKESVQEKVSNILNKKGIDVVIDTTGITSMINLGISLLADSGRFIMVGHPNPNDDTIEIKNANHMFNGIGKKLMATQGGQTNPQKDINRYLRLYENKMLNLKELITNRFELNEVNNAISTLKQGKSGRIIINCNKEK